MKKLIPIIGLITAFNLFAGTAPASKSLLDKSKEYVGGLEYSVDVFGTYSVNRGPFEDVLKSGFKGGTFGIGLGANVFLSKNVGVKLDSVVNAVDKVSGAVIDYSSASFVLRFPTKIGLNPYGLAGVGRNWDTERWNTHFGVGTTFALSSDWSIEGEFRHVFEARRSDYDQIRVGVLYKF